MRAFHATCGLLLVVVIASHSAAAFRMHADPDPQRTRERLARLLNESPSGGTILTYEECNALPVEFDPLNDVANCGTLFKWRQWPTPEGFCQESQPFDGTLTNAVAVCAAKHSTCKMFAPANDAERCTLTHYKGAYPATNSQWMLSGITDVATEGVWLGPDGEAIDPAYINWAAGQPDGGVAENCVAYLNNEAYDRDCNNLSDQNRGVLCVVRPTPAA